MEIYVRSSRAGSVWVRCPGDSEESTIISSNGLLGISNRSFRVQLAEEDVAYLSLRIYFSVTVVTIFVESRTFFLRHPTDFPFAQPR